MKNLVRLSLAVFVLVVSCGPAMAFWDNWPDVSDGMVKTLGKMTRDRMDDMMQKQEGRSLTPETAAEKQKPMLPYENERRTVRRGLINVYADWCGFDWQQKSALPYLMEENNKHVWTERQMAYMKYLQQVTMNGLEHTIKKGNCPPATKRVVENYIYK